VPWEHSALTAPFYFTAPASAIKATPEQLELSFWNAVKDSRDPKILGTYLERYPKGTFAPLAKAMIEKRTQEMAAASDGHESSGSTAANDSDDQRVRLAAAPKIPDPSVTFAGPFDGKWAVTRTGQGRCAAGRVVVFKVFVRNGIANRGRGSVSDAGEFKFRGTGMDGNPAIFTGKIVGDKGSGTFHHPKCRGTFTMVRDAS
jgi:hypothetical protein